VHVAVLLLGLFASVGCAEKRYRFSYPRVNRRVTAQFVASTTYSLPHSPAPEIALYNVLAESGTSRPGVVCYVPTEIELAYDESGPEVWKRTADDSSEYDMIATAAIDRDKYAALRSAISANTPNVSATLVPCECLLNSVDVPGTLSGVEIAVMSYFGTGGDLFWVIAMRVPNSMVEQVEELMRSPTGLLLPTKATLGGVNLTITPPFELRASVPVRYF
jgi:hypothetical protein